MSIAPAILMPSNPPAIGETRAADAEGGNAFASLLEAEVDSAETPAAPAAIQTYSTVAPALQLQTQATDGAGDGAIEGLVAPAIAANPTDAAGVTTPADATTLPEGVAADAANANGSAQPTVTATPQQSAAAAVVAVSAIVPADATTDTDIEVTETSAESAAEGAQTGTATPATPAGALAAPLAATAPVMQGAAEASAAATPPAPATPESAPAIEGAEADTAETVPANTGARAAAQTLNQPAAAAAAQSSTTAPADASAAKPDFAAMLASQSAQGADSATQTTSQATNQASETARTAPTPAALQSAPAATVQVYNRIIERADGRAQRFEIRLDPAELGRVDVRIEIGADRKVHAVLAAHDSAALSDLMRGQRALERALTDAGLDLADNGVRFELARDNANGGANQQRDSEGRPAQGDVWRRFDAMTMPATNEAAAIVQPSWRPQRLDLVA